MELTVEEDSDEPATMTANLGVFQLSGGEIGENRRSNSSRSGSDASKLTCDLQLLFREICGRRREEKKKIRGFIILYVRLRSGVAESLEALRAEALIDGTHVEYGGILFSS